MKVYILFMWLVSAPQPHAEVVYTSQRTCDTAAHLINAGRDKPVAYCVESHLEENK